MIFIDFYNLLNDKGWNLYSILASCRRNWGASLLFEKGIEKIVKWYLFSKITPSLFVDKASCTRQFESKLSLHSLASLFPLKEGSTSHPDPLTLRGEGGNRPTRCSEPLRSKDGGASKPSPNCAGWDRRGKRVYS